MTLEDIERAIGEYEKALAWIVTQVKNDGQLLQVAGMGIPVGRVRDLMQDIEALNLLREYLTPQTEGEQE